MLPNIYKETFNSYFESEDFNSTFTKAMSILNSGVKRIFFIGNGGSNSICSHMYEDFAKIGRFQTYTFSDGALITCYANDYGYDKAMAEWLKVYIQEGDLLIAISSSGNSSNILNACNEALNAKAQTIVLSGFKNDNKLRQIGDVSFYIPATDYGVVECFHQVILHSLLDTYSKK
jgi:D-sedoheptulose 7-phosphate isomerase